MKTGKPQTPRRQRRWQNQIAVDLRLRRVPLAARVLLKQLWTVHAAMEAMPDKDKTGAEYARMTQHYGRIFDRLRVFAR